MCIENSDLSSASEELRQWHLDPELSAYTQPMLKEAQESIEVHYLSAMSALVLRDMILSIENPIGLPLAQVLRDDGLEHEAMLLIRRFGTTGALLFACMLIANEFVCAAIIDPSNIDNAESEMNIARQAYKVYSSRRGILQ